MQHFEMPLRQEIPMLFDVLIVGAGPCGLAVAARLCEHTPSAIFTDEEHQRYHWIKKHGNRMSIKCKDGGTKVPCSHNSEGSNRKYKTLILDSTADEWMARWNHLFSLFGIKHLRSPMFFHVDPQDRDGLLAHTYEEDRAAELLEIRNCVGREVSKHKKKMKMKKQSRSELGQAAVTIDERDRKDYFNPSSSLFKHHCECIVDRYGLKNSLIRKELVQDLDYGSVQDMSGAADDVFTVTTDKACYHARTVVLAVGAANPPSIPSITLSESQSFAGVSHSMHIKEFPDPSVAAKVKDRRITNVAIVGGGLTSAQLGDLAIKRGVTKVWHFMRGTLKVKPFDVDLAWMSKFKNHEKAVFWSADSDEERLEQIRQARGGGSINPPFHSIMKQHMDRDNLLLYTRTTLHLQQYDASTARWKVKTCPAIEELPPMDFVYFATGIQPDFSELSYLQTMRKKFPIHGHGGLPCLNDDLMWCDGVPLFITGRLASLRLGPGAGNLEGARLGAERIAWSLETVLRGTTQSCGSETDERYRYHAGVGSRFESLEEDTSQAWPDNDEEDHLQGGRETLISPVNDANRTNQSQIS